MPEIASKCTAEGKEELDFKALCRIIDEFVDMGGKALVFTGGEPLLRPDIYSLVSHACSRGLLVHVSTNGLLLGNEEAQKLVASGVESISVSLDGSLAEVHESTRSPHGSFEHAIRAIKLLKEQRTLQGASLRLKILSVVGKNNSSNLSSLVSLAHDLGVDGIELMPCQPLVDCCEEITPDKMEISREIECALSVVTENRSLSHLVDNSAYHLSLFGRSFAGEKSPIPCYIGYTGIVIDCYGDVYPCLPWVSWKRKPIQITEENSLDSAWRSKEYSNWRKEIEHCGNCYLNCHAELSITLGGRFWKIIDRLRGA
jgi:radical SAM protein with 4Fe4S-binding SPASM domain